jgi:hypothetical protein
MKFYILIFFEKSVEKIQVSLISDKNKGTLFEDLCAFLIISRSVLLRIKNVSEHRSREYRNTHLCSILFWGENRAVYEIMWKNIVQWGRLQMTI